MTFISRVWAIAWSTAAQPTIYRRLMNGMAGVILAVIVAITIFFWPIPYLGFNVDPLTATISFIEPGSSAAHAGLHVGDRVLRMYDRSWNELIVHPNILSLVGPREQAIPISIERAGDVFTIPLVQAAPTLSFQTAKVTNILLALLCWATGYVLGIVRRHEAAGSPPVAWFWLGLSAVLGIYFFARFASYPLRLAMQWVLLTVLFPLAIYIHIWFPPRSITPRQARVARRALVWSWVLLNIGLLATIAVWRPTLVQLVISLSDILPISVLLSLIGSGAILRRAYRQMPIAHLRRQIRLIALACAFVAIAWLLLLVLPSLTRGEALIADHWIDLITGAVPLAYLVGGVAPDLYRLDRMVLRLGVHVGTTLVLAQTLAAITTTFALHGTLAVLWTAITFVILYRPVQHLGFRLLPAYASPAHTYRALHAASTKLTSTLEQSLLIDAMCAGIRATFGEPALVFYTGNIDGSNELTLARQERMPTLSGTIRAGVLTDQLCSLSPITESRALHATLAPLTLTHIEEQVLHHPGPVLWCPIRHTQGHLLGLLLLGMRGDLDPYRAQDLWELQRLLEATALAFTNSAAYMQQCEAEDTIRHLYQRLQHAQDMTAAAIARELHDEIINVNVRLNIQSLQNLIGQVHDPALQAELALVLESEYTEAQALRMICEQLHPTGIDDPLGLAAVLRMQVEKIQSVWPGECRLVVEHAPIPIAATTQREAMGITQEALSNAAKHAAATEIVVHLCYPETPSGMIQLSIRDNGRTGKAISASPGHWGVRNMRERAQAVGGTLKFRRELDGGTTVVFTFFAESVSITN